MFQEGIIIPPVKLVARGTIVPLPNRGPNIIKNRSYPAPLLEITMRRLFQRVGGAPLPVWFHTLPGSHGDFGAVVAAMSASDSAGASAAIGGGAGASGGGLRGAG